MWENAKIIGANQNRGEAGQERGHKDFVMSRSQLVAFAENPAKWIAGGEIRQETKSMTFGSVLDCLTTDGEKFMSRFIVAPDSYPVADAKGKETGERKPWNLNSNWCKKYKSDAEAQGLQVVTIDLYKEAQLAFKTLHSERSIAAVIECSEKQVLGTAEWLDNDTGLIIPFSILIDLVPHHTSPTFGKMLVDIKTTRNGNPANWANVCNSSEYDVQASLYFDIYRAARPKEDRTDFAHIVQENTFPFHVVSPMMAFSYEFLDWGRQKYKKALRLYAQCLATGVWPGYEMTGTPYGSTQLISPDELYEYRKCAGMTEFRMPEPQPEEPANETIDIVP